MLQEHNRALKKGRMEKQEMEMDTEMETDAENGNGHGKWNFYAHA